MSGYHWRLILNGALLAAVVIAAGSQASAAALRIAQDDSGASISDGDRLVLHYRYKNVPFKPYVDQLLSPAGVQILRDSPSDHVHHHGLMYGLAVDGVTFWNETGKGLGQQKQKSMRETPASDGEETGRAGFVQELDWVGPAGGRLLVERRSIDVRKAADIGATLVDWRCRLQTPPDKDKSVITGHAFDGLGMRFLASMDQGGRFFNSDDNAGAPILYGDLRLTPVKWMAYTAQRDGAPVTVAMFDHPMNARFPGQKFTMRKPFAYLAATLNEWKAPLTITAGKPLDLRYGVALWDGAVDKQTVEKLYQRWLLMDGKEATNDQPAAKAPLADALGRWPVAKTRKWRSKQGWLTGCNFIPRNAVNQLEMWQADTFDPATIDRTLGWAESIGFNTVRVFLHDLLWKQDSKGFLD